MADFLGMGADSAFGNELNRQQMDLARIAQTRAATRHQLATTDYIGAMTRETENRVRNAELEADAGEKIAAMMAMAQEGTEAPVDPATALNTIASTYIKGGLVKKGAEILKQASAVTAQQAVAGARTTAAAVAKQKADMAMIEKYSSMLGGVEDQAGWDFIKESILEDEPEMQKWVGRLGDYTPEKAGALRAAMAKYKDKVWAENARKRTEIYERLQGARTDATKTQSELRKQKLDLERQREARLAKEGGDRSARADRKAEGKSTKPKTPTAAGMPTKAEISMVEDQLKALNVKGDPADNQEIAQTAKIRWKANPALTPAQATAQVIQDKMKNGEITAGSETKGILGTGIGKKKIPGEVFSKAKPAALPAKLEEAVVGQYYQTPKGVHRYLGNDEFEPVK
jgi:hypothetical protein